MNDSIAVFALGWACGPAIVQETAEELRRAFGQDMEIIFLYDWRNIPSANEAAALKAKVESYANRYLIAWSFGVWAAEQIFTGIKFTRAIALNGTPLPADENMGIGVKRLKITLRGFAVRGTEEFDRRAYGNQYDKVSAHINPRSVEENISELQHLIEESEKPYEPSLHWDAATAGSGDQIFPPENMARYWGDKAKILPLPHYPFEDPALIVALLRN